MLFYIEKEGKKGPIIWAEAPKLESEINSNSGIRMERLGIKQAT